jgi:serine/threonine protein kinase
MSQDGRAPDPATRTEGETLDMPEGMQSFSPGQVVGDRYQILEMLGRGGMGEVWHAFDLKLRVEVALKALRPEFFKSERRLELLRQEVRAAREVVSPNVCRIFDLIEIEGRELVSMEYVDGATLLVVLQERGPLELKEAQDIASQFLAGLEAIHRVGLIHRDIKPENIMLTRAGRVVVMDFGLARQEAEGGGSVSGTPAYMAPEQAAGQTLDARADVYAAGVVLAEMVSPEGIKSYESRQSVWEGVRSEPAKIPDSPWAPVLKKAVAKDRENRYHTAHTLTRALENVTLRVEGAEDVPRPRVLHRGGRRILLRSRGRGRADVAQARGADEDAGPGRSIGRGENLLSSGRAFSGRNGSLGLRHLQTGEQSAARFGSRSGARDGRRSTGHGSPASL